MNKKSMKKSLAIVLAMLLVCVISVAGTLAYLQASSGSVTNTFVVGNLFDDTADETDGFVLKEHTAVYQGNGNYILKDGKPGRDYEETDGNEYEQILPGVNVPKDPFVRVTELKEDAYVFIEVVNGLTDGLGFTVDDKYWVEVTGKTGPNGGAIYAYQKEGVNTLKGRGIDASPEGNYTYTINILDNTEVTVPSDFKTTKDVGTLTFYGYIIQAAGLADYTAAWNAYVH